MWLDLMTPTDYVAKYLKVIEQKTNPNGIVMITFIRGREHTKIDDRVSFIMSHLQDMELIDSDEYKDSSPMMNITLRKRLTTEYLEQTIYLGPETNQTQTQMEIQSENQGKSIKITVEKLDGGFISNVTGKRSIFKDAESITDVIDLEKAINTLENDEYHVDVYISPKSSYVDLESLIALHNSEEVLTLESAKENGIIESEKYNPIPAPVEPDLKAPIKVTVANAYTIERLKAIDWEEMHKQLPLQPIEVSKMTGMNNTTLYTSLPKARKGELTFSNTATRIGFTILAQYYERTLNIRTSTKEQNEKMKEDLLKLIRDVEVIGSGKDFIKMSIVATKLIEMRKILM
jgi:hypothetical protein